jgi:hypothetical protein
VTARDQGGACDRTITDQAEEGTHCAVRPHPRREERTKGRRIKSLPRFTLTEYRDELLDLGQGRDRDDFQMLGPRLLENTMQRKHREGRLGEVDKAVALITSWLAAFPAAPAASITQV